MSFLAQVVDKEQINEAPQRKMTLLQLLWFMVVLENDFDCIEFDMSSSFILALKTASLSQAASAKYKKPIIPRIIEN